jgi:protein subunit release factor B
MLNFGVSPQKHAELQDRMAKCNLRESDLKETFVRSSGPGGQNVNRTSTCVYIKHLPTGLEVKMQRARTQGLNRFHARRRLCELLESQFMPEKSPETLTREKLRKQKLRRKRRSRSA